jgi:hypothetical protein
MSLFLGLKLTENVKKFTSLPKPHLNCPSISSANGGAYVSDGIGRFFRSVRIFKEHCRLLFSQIIKFPHAFFLGHGAEGAAGAGRVGALPLQHVRGEYALWH